MSSRSLRKLQGRDLLPFSLPEKEDESESEEEENLNIQTSAAVNKFALLHASDDDDNDSDVEQEKKEDVDSEPQKKNTTQRTSKTKRKNRKKKIKPSNNKADSDEDIFKHLSTDMESVSLTGSSSKSKKKPMKNVFNVEHRHLNPDNELRRIFSTRVLMGDASYRRRNQATLTSRGIWLTQPSNNWARLGRTGIKMVQFETKNGFSYFKFVHDEDYQRVQFKFLDAVQSSDHRNIADLLEKHTYHVDSLLTFSDVYKIHEDTKMARELIERALYCLETSFHTCFNITTGKCRLPYKYAENRCLFLSLFKHMNFVAQRGCNRTALELSKFLLSLDPEDDPLCCIFLLDNFGLRASEYEFLIKFAKDWGINRNLQQLPNWAYSLALAQFSLVQSSSSSTEEADETLQTALIMFPSVLLCLLEKCSVQPDAKVKSHPYFTTQAKESLPQGLALLCHMFVQRNYALWKDQDALAWLERNVNSVLEKLDLATSKTKSFVKSCRHKRMTRYQKPPINVHRHALISELPEISAFIPLEIRSGTMLSHDPLPPPDTVVSYHRSERNHLRRSENPVSLFFHSLLPDYNPDMLNVNADELADERQQQNLGRLGGSVQTLMDAMRELIQNIHEPFAANEEEDFAQDWD